MSVRSLARTAILSCAIAIAGCGKNATGPEDCSRLPLAPASARVDLV